MESQDFDCKYGLCCHAGHNLMESQSSMYSEREIENAKGFLLELSAKNPRKIQIPTFTMIHQSPFVCTVTVHKFDANELPLVLSSEPFSTKKAAEQDAARKMLHNVRFVQLIPHSTKVVKATLPGLPEAISDKMILANMTLPCHDPRTDMPSKEIENIAYTDGLSTKTDSSAQIAQVRISLFPPISFILLC